jgi:kynureninase
MEFEPTREQARTLDAKDSLASFRDNFFIPRKLKQPCIYFCGNSLGLQPKTTRAFLETELNSWSDYGVHGHFQGKNPWFHYHQLFPSMIGNLVGAMEEEVVVMNTLTTNLHLLLVSFYRPDKSRFKILTEGGNFPSDYYALESQVKFHGFSFDEAVVEIFPREGEDSLRTEDILAKIDGLGESLSLVMMSGVNYYTGQKFQMAEITQAAHKVGALAGFDLAHAIGNVSLSLHNWEVDFATWCSYKYLNSGPGGPGGIFINNKYANSTDIPRFAGWWGHDEGVRFQMKKGFIPMNGAPGWQLSNAQIFGMAAHLSALKIFEQAGMENLVEKSEIMILYLQFLFDKILSEVSGEPFYILTPAEYRDRGCQFSIVLKKNGKEVFEFLGENGVVADWRDPDVIRIAPVPLYNSFEEIFMFSELFKKALLNVS